MKKIKITVPATTSNMGPGFDFLGMSLSLYNTYLFEESKKFEFVGFESIDNNMAYQAYLLFMQRHSKKECPVKITLIRNEVPSSRGLGSSATAVVAGIRAANYMLGDIVSEEEMIKEMVDFEGHPDNILAAYYGGMVSSVYDNNKLLSYKHEVSDKLKFTLVVPSYSVKTKDARSILPKTLKYSDVLYNASRAFILESAYKNGDIGMLKIASKDTIHEKYRATLIKDYILVKSLENKYNLVVNISGSGSTMLIISLDRDFTKDIKNLEVIPVGVEKNGMVLEVIKWISQS